MEIWLLVAFGLLIVFALLFDGGLKTRRRNQSDHHTGDAGPFTSNRKGGHNHSDASDFDGGGDGGGGGD